MIFLTREGCGLCDRALTVVNRAVRRLDVDIDVVDIDTDEDLLSRFDLRVPVLMRSDGQVIAEGEIEDVRSVRRAVKRSV